MTPEAPTAFESVHLKLDGSPDAATWLYTAWVMDEDLLSDRTNVHPGGAVIV
jgi:hypothetical protein